MDHSLPTVDLIVRATGAIVGLVFVWFVADMLIEAVRDRRGARKVTRERREQLELFEGLYSSAVRDGDRAGARQVLVTAAALGLRLKESPVVAVPKPVDTVEEEGRVELKPTGKIVVEGPCASCRRTCRDDSPNAAALGPLCEQCRATTDRARKIITDLQKRQQPRPAPTSTPSMGAETKK